MKRVILIGALLLSGCAPDKRAPENPKVRAEAHAVMLEGFVLKVQARAKEYAAKKKLKLLRTDLPRIQICRSEEELLKIREKDSDKVDKVLCGLCDYKNRTIYSLGMDYEVLAHEFGHWYFGTDEDRADDFAWFFCEGEKVKALPILNR